MNNKIVAYIGILGVSLFGLAAIIGPLLIEDYSIVSQYISESFASNTQYGKYLQYLGYVPSGILTAIFCALFSLLISKTNAFIPCASLSAVTGSKHAFCFAFG